MIAIAVLSARRASAPENGSSAGTLYGCARQDSNLRPLPPQGSALSPELRARGTAVSVSAPGGPRPRARRRRAPRRGRRRARGPGTALVTRPTTSPSYRTSAAWRAASPSSSSTRSVRFTWPRLLQPRERLLARVAALGERDGALVEAGLGREDALVDLAAPARGAGEDAQPLELLVGRRGVDDGVEHLDRGHAVVARRDPVAPRRRRSPRCAPRARSRSARRSARASAGRARSRRARAR